MHKSNPIEGVTETNCSQPMSVSADFMSEPLVMRPALPRNDNRLLGCVGQTLEMMPLFQNQASRENQALQTGNKINAFLDENVKPNEITFWNGVVTSDKVLSMKREINKYGQTPEQAIVSAAAQSNVIGLGDVHTATGNPARKLYADMMPRLAKVGVTDLAIELPRSLQPVFDEFKRTGKWNIPDDQARTDYRIMHNLIKYSPDLVNIFEQARRSGINIDCVDASGVNFPHIDDTVRNQAMAKNIEEKIRSSPRAKVAFMAGSYHLEQGQNQAETPTAVQLLRNDKLNVTTFQPQIGGARDKQSGYDPRQLVLFPLTEDVKQAVSVSTSAARTVGQLPLWMPGGNEPRDTMSNWNNVLIFP